MNSRAALVSSIFLLSILYFQYIQKLQKSEGRHGRPGRDQTPAPNGDIGVVIDAASFQRQESDARARFEGLGADYLIDSTASLLPVIDEISARSGAGSGREGDSFGLLTGGLWVRVQTCGFLR